MSRDRLVFGLIGALVASLAYLAFAPRPTRAQQVGGAGVIGNSDARYQLLYAPAVRSTVLGPDPANTVLRIDTVTGETWIYHPQGWKAVRLAQ